jgi:hypothetical protein
MEKRSETLTKVKLYIPGRILHLVKTKTGTCSSLDLACHCDYFYQKRDIIALESDAFTNQLKRLMPTSLRLRYPLQWFGIIFLTSIAMNSMQLLLAGLTKIRRFYTKICKSICFPRGGFL